MNPRPRQLMNGDIIFPHRGKPPEKITGYMVDPKDEYFFHKIYPKCDFRIYRTVPTPCGAKKYHYFCTKILDENDNNTITNYYRCEKCLKES